MHTFCEWLDLLDRLLETYYTFDPKQWNDLFDQELQKVFARTTDPQHRQALERMQGINWVSYVASSVRKAGFRDYREGQEAITDICTKLLTGKLFTGFDERTSGPMDLRFKASVGNAIRNLVQKTRTRKRRLPTIPIQPGYITPDEIPDRSAPDHDEKIIDDFRELLRARLGDLAVAVFDIRMSGEETQSIINSPALDNPSMYVVKRSVRAIKRLAREFAASLGDSTLLRRIEKAMGDEEATVQKRLATGASRRGW